MHNAEQDFPTLDPATLELLERWLKSGKLPVAQAAEVNTAMQVRYLARALPESDLLAVEEALARQPAARQQLRAVRERLSALQRLPWPEVTARAQGEGLDAEVARVWLELANAQAAALPGLSVWWQMRDWEAKQQALRAGMREALAAWTAFLAFGQEWHAEMLRPRLATARGGDETMIREGDLAGIARLDAEIREDGALYVTVARQAEASQSDSLPAPAWEGSTLSLALQGAGEIWPLASTILTEDVASFAIPDVGTILSLEPGRVPSERFRISLSPFEAGEPLLPVTLLAEVEAAGSTLLQANPALVVVEQIPRRESGQLVLTLSLPALTRTAYAGYTLRLDLQITPARAQHLGAWPVSQWGDTSLLLSISCPGDLDAAWPLVSSLRFRLTSPVGA